MANKRGSKNQLVTDKTGKKPTRALDQATIATPPANTAGPSCRIRSFADRAVNGEPVPLSKDHGQPSGVDTKKVVQGIVDDCSSGKRFSELRQKLRQISGLEAPKPQCSDAWIALAKRVGMGQVDLPLRGSQQELKRQTEILIQAIGYFEHLRDSQPNGNDLITAAAADKKYASKSTLRRYVKAGKIRDYRPEGCPPNAGGLYSETELKRYFAPKR